MSRVADAWRALTREQRLAALAAGGLFFSMFLPWYSESFFEHGRVVQTSSNAFQAFSFVEAAVLLVSGAVLAMLFARAERRSFQLPGGDGLVVMIAGGWSALLIFYRLLDKPGVQGSQRLTATVGVLWGIFVALLVAIGLAYAGGRMRALARAREPGDGGDRSGARDPLAGAMATQSRAHGERPTTVLARPASQAAASALEEQRPARRRPRYPPAPGEAQMSLQESPHRADDPAKQLSLEDPPGTPG